MENIYFRITHLDIQGIHYEQRCSILLQTSCVSGDRANSNLFPWLENATCAEPWLHRWRSRLLFFFFCTFFGRSDIRLGYFFYVYIYLSFT